MKYPYKTAWLINITRMLGAKFQLRAEGIIGLSGLRSSLKSIAQSGRALTMPQLISPDGRLWV